MLRGMIETGDNMPNWKIHIEVAKKLNEKLNYRDQDYQLFLFGNILPDINNAYIVTNISKIISHSQTHYADGDEVSYLNFYEAYKNKIISSPLICGYFVHLFTDYYWNDDFIIRFQAKKPFCHLIADDVRILKQSDFKAYNDYYHDNNLDLVHPTVILDNIAELDRVSITEEDIVAVMEFLRNQKLSNLTFQVTTKEQFDELLKDTVEQSYDIIKNW